MVIALVDVIPQDGLFPVLGEHGRQAFREIAHLGFHIIPLALFGSGGLAVRALLPVPHGAFVTADVDVREREYLLDGIEGILKKLFSGRFLRANQLGGNTAVRPYLGPFGVAAEFGIGRGQGHVMTRHFHFRQYLDTARFAVGYQVLELLLGIHAFIGQQGVVLAFRSGGADGADGAELVVARHGETPALVFRQMEMQDVVFVIMHGVHKIVDLLHGIVVAAYVYHHAAPAEVGGILDAAAGKALRSIRKLVLELEQGRHGHGLPVGRGITEFHAAGRQFHGIPFIAQSGDFLLMDDFEVFGSSGSCRHVDGLRNNVVGIGSGPAEGTQERCG
ncbi:unknown [Akkermansia muciniphila CAG:154]|nr:unknown [Akkermansia muciniphila CAG:154]